MGRVGVVANPVPIRVQGLAPVVREGIDVVADPISIRVQGLIPIVREGVGVVADPVTVSICCLIGIVGEGIALVTGPIRLDQGILERPRSRSLRCQDTHRPRSGRHPRPHRRDR